MNLIKLAYHPSHLGIRRLQHPWDFSTKVDISNRFELFNILDVDLGGAFPSTFEVNGDKTVLVLCVAEMTCGGILKRSLFLEVVKKQECVSIRAFF